MNQYFFLRNGCFGGHFMIRKMDHGPSLLSHLRSVPKNSEGQGNSTRANCWAWTKVTSILQKCILTKITEGNGQKISSIWLVRVYNQQLHELDNTDNLFICLWTLLCWYIHNIIHLFMGNHYYKVLQWYSLFNNALSEEIAQSTVYHHLRQICVYHP